MNAKDDGNVFRLPSTAASWRSFYIWTLRFLVDNWQNCPRQGLQLWTDRAAENQGRLRRRGYPCVWGGCWICQGDKMWMWWVACYSHGVQCQCPLPGLSDGRLAKDRKLHTDEGRCGTYSSSQKILCYKISLENKLDVGACCAPFGEWVPLHGVKQTKLEFPPFNAMCRDHSKELWKLYSSVGEFFLPAANSMNRAPIRRVHHSSSGGLLRALGTLLAEWRTHSMRLTTRRMECNRPNSTKVRDRPLDFPSLFIKHEYSSNAIQQTTAICIEHWLVLKYG